MLQTFEHQYRKLCSAFGIAFNDGRCRVYYDKIGADLDDERRWERMVSKAMNEGTSFPKISDLMAMPEWTHRKDAETNSDPLEEWVRSDCPVKECNAGYIHVAVLHGGRVVPLIGPDAIEGVENDREVSYRCVKCNRVGGTGIPGWHREVNMRTATEMMERMMERRRIASETRSGNRTPVRLTAEQGVA